MNNFSAKKEIVIYFRWDNILKEKVNHLYSCIYRMDGKLHLK